MTNNERTPRRRRSPQLARAQSKKPVTNKTHTSRKQSSTMPHVDVPAKAEYEWLSQAASITEPFATAEEAIKAWNTGKPVHVIVMGGLSLNYERAIHELAFALLAAMLASPPGSGWDSLESTASRAAYLGGLAEDEGVAKAWAKVRPTETIVAQAAGLAAVMAKNGYLNCIQRAPLGRVILLANHA